MPPCPARARAGARGRRHQPRRRGARFERPRLPGDGRAGGLVGRHRPQRAVTSRTCSPFRATRCSRWRSATTWPAMVRVVPRTDRRRAAPGERDGQAYGAPSVWGPEYILAARRACPAPPTVHCWSSRLRPPDRSARRPFQIALPRSCWTAGSLHLRHHDLDAAADAERPHRRLHDPGKIELQASARPRAVTWRPRTASSRPLPASVRHVDLLTGETAKAICAAMATSPSAPTKISSPIAERLPRSGRLRGDRDPFAMRRRRHQRPATRDAGGSRGAAPADRVVVRADLPLDLVHGCAGGQGKAGQAVGAGITSSTRRGRTREPSYEVVTHEVESPLRSPPWPVATATTRRLRARHRRRHRDQRAARLQHRRGDGQPDADVDRRGEGGLNLIVRAGYAEPMVVSRSRSRPGAWSRPGTADLGGRDGAAVRSGQYDGVSAAGDVSTG